MAKRNMENKLSMRDEFLDAALDFTFGSFALLNILTCSMGFNISIMWLLTLKRYPAMVHTRYTRLCHATLVSVSVAAAIVILVAAAAVAGLCFGPGRETRCCRAGCGNPPRSRYWIVILALSAFSLYCCAMVWAFSLVVYLKRNTGEMFNELQTLGLAGLIVMSIHFVMQIQLFLMTRLWLKYPIRDKPKAS